MEDVRLYLDGVLVDIDPNTEIIETKQINNIFDLQDRQTSFTSNFNLLLTERTSRVLDKAGHKYNTSKKPYQYLKTDCYRNGVNTIHNGKFIIDQINEASSVKANIQDGNVDFFEAMGDKSLAALDFSSLEHIYSPALFLASQTNIWSDGYIYAVSDYGFYNESNVNLEYQAPCVFLKWIFEQLFIQNGFTYSYIGANNPLSSSHFESKAITLSSGIETEGTGTNGLILELEKSGNRRIESLVYLDMNEISDVDNYHQGGFIVPTSSNYYSIDLNVTFTGLGQVKIWLNGNAIKSYQGSGVVSDNFLLYLTPADTIRISYNKYGSTANDESVITFYDINFKMTINNSLINIDFNNLFSDIKQKDFYKSVLQMYGIISQKEAHLNNYRLISMNDLLGGTNGSLDLSDKYNKINIEKPKFGRFAQNNDLTYKYINNLENFANNTFIIEDKTLVISSKLINSIYYAPKITDSQFNLNYVRETTLFDVETNDDGTIKKAKSIKGAPYIVNVKKITGDINYSFISNISTSESGIPLSVLNFDDLSWPYLWETYYPNYYKTINRIKFFEVELALTSVDVHNFDFLRLIYLKQFQRYFYVNKIKSFRGGKTTKVELIEVDLVDN